MDRDRALNWIGQNTTGLYRGDDRGANRARRLAATRTKLPKPPPVALPEPAPAAPAEPDDAYELARLALALAFRLHARIVAESVLEAGGSIEVAFAAARLAHGPTISAATRVLHCLGHPDFEDGEDGEALRLRETGHVEPDWRILALSHGRAFDPAAAVAHLDACPAWADDAPGIEFTTADLTAGMPEGTH